MLIILALLLALVSPLLLLPMEKLLPFPYLIEETVKLAIVLLILKAAKTPWLPKQGNSSKIKELKNNFWIWVFLAGFLFTLSESILYLVNIFALGNLTLFFKRVIITGILHSGTILLMYSLGRRKYAGLLIGFAGSISIHYFFNLWLANFY